MTRLKVPDMSCGHCKAAVEKAVASVDPGASVDVDLDRRIASITSNVGTAALIEALKGEGYDSTPA